MTKQFPIGVFDSGYGGLTILRRLRAQLPQYDYIYLGDNARTPYGARSFEVIYKYTLEAVEALFARGCRLVILACNTASAKALRSIQQIDLPRLDPSRRVLGVIRPTVEAIPQLTKSGHVGLLGTSGTVSSGSYKMEVCRLKSYINLTALACPMWVPLVENGEAEGPGADYFVKKNIDDLLTLDPNIDTIILGCTHYPLLINKIRQYVPSDINLIEQGEYVAHSLSNYLQRHPEIESLCSKNCQCTYLTTEQASKFEENAGIFLHAEHLHAEQIELPMF